MTLDGILNSINSLPDGLEYGLIGAVCGFIVQAIFFSQNWGDLDWLFKSVGIAFMIVVAISTFKDVTSENKGFQIGFIIVSLIMIGV